MIDDIFDKIDEVTDKHLSELSKSLSKTNDKLFAEFSEVIASLDKSADGYIKTTVSNLRKIANFNKSYASATSTYTSAVNSYVVAFSENQALINSYMQSFGMVEKTIYELVREDAVSTTLNSLLGTGIDSTFKEPLNQILKNMVVNGSNKTEAVNTLKNYLYGQGDKVDPLSKYVNQVADDAIGQFNGSYIATISDDIGLEHFYYKGTKVTDTRDFCQLLAGKYATYNSLERFIKKQSAGNGWSGMIPGTNMGNFMTYRGGYRCRHYLLPVSKVVYDANKGRHLLN